MASARERLDLAKAEEVEFKNAIRRGEYLSAKEVKAMDARIAIAFREAALNLTAVAVQRGLVAREHEEAHRALIDDMLKALAAWK